jgi:gamma-glutamyltranspeptidase/glutathione hydrolase
LGGVLDYEDLAGHSSDLVKPLCLFFYDLLVYECPPNGQGIVALVALGLIQTLVTQGRVCPVHEMKHNSAEYLHLVIETLRIAFADALTFVADPRTDSFDANKLLSSVSHLFSYPRNI